MTPSTKDVIHEMLSASTSDGMLDPVESPWEQIGAEVGRLVAAKQEAYGDSFGKSGAVMRILYPDGISPDQMDDALTLVRMVDKMFRVATDRDALGESPYRDLAGYALLAVVRSGR